MKFSIYKEKTTGILCWASVTRSDYVKAQFVKDGKAFTMRKSMFRENFEKQDQRLIKVKDVTNGITAQLERLSSKQDWNNWRVQYEKNGLELLGRKAILTDDTLNDMIDQNIRIRVKNREFSIIEFKNNEYRLSCELESENPLFSSDSAFNGRLDLFLERNDFKLI